MVELIKRLSVKISLLEFLKTTTNFTEEQLQEINEKQNGYKAQKIMLESIVKSRQQEKVA